MNLLGSLLDILGPQTAHLGACGTLAILEVHARGLQENYRPDASLCRFIGSEVGCLVRVAGVIVPGILLMLVTCDSYSLLVYCLTGIIREKRDLLWLKTSVVNIPWHSFGIAGNWNPQFWPLFLAFPALLLASLRAF